MSEIYETPSVLSDYLLFHYGSPEEILTPEIQWPQGMRDALGFPVRTPSRFSNPAGGRGLDLGCAVGRSTYEMSRNCSHVTGMDFSHAFIAAAERLRGGDSISYKRLDEGHLKTNLTARLPQGIAAEKVDFFQGDAMDLPANLGSFDRVHAANLICRLPEPECLLSRLPALLNPGGQLVLATPCTWLEEFTPSGNWPPGETFQWLEKHLGRSFRLLSKADEPFLIRESARKFQWTRSMLTVWSRI